MDFKTLENLIYRSLNRPPPRIINEIGGNYYESYYTLMYYISQLTNGPLVELGVEKGRGIASFAVGNTQRKVYGIDHTLRLEALEWQKKFNWIVLLNQDSLPVPDTIKQLDQKIDCLHIDTEHSYSMAKAEFEAYQPYLASPAVVLFDDLHAQNDAVLEYFNTLDYEKIHDDRLHPSCGYGVVLYE